MEADIPVTVSPDDRTFCSKKIKCWAEGSKAMPLVTEALWILTRVIFFVIICKEEQSLKVVASAFYLEPIIGFFLMCLIGRRTSKLFSWQYLNEAFQHLEIQLATIPNRFITIHTYFYDDSQANTFFPVILIEYWTNLAWNQKFYFSILHIAFSISSMHAKNQIKWQNQLKSTAERQGIEDKAIKKVTFSREGDREESAFFHRVVWKDDPVRSCCQHYQKFISRSWWFFIFCKSNFFN